MKTVLILVVELLVLAAPIALWSYLPFRAWLRRRIAEPVRRWVVDEIRRRRRAMARKHADVLLEEARGVLPEVATDRVPQGWGLAPIWIQRWWYAAQLAVPATLVVVVLGVLAVWNFPAHVHIWPLPARHDGHAGKLDPLRALVDSIVSVPRTVQSWKSPADAFDSLRYVLICVIALLAAPLFLRIGAALSEGQEQRQRRERVERKKWTMNGDYVQCWPVVVLVVAAVQCARAHKQWATRQPGDDLPRVSMRAAERVIWRAHRIRRGKGRAHHERVLKAHASQVVGALRAAEAEQDTEPGRALRDLTVMLLTIAERYAEGRVGRLLDDDQIGDATPVVPRERLRMAAVGVVVILVMTGAAVAGLPEAALTVLIPVVVLAAVIAINRGKVPSPGELTNLIIPH
ncbi:hypothetical protein ACIQCG_26155 [Streptomyces noursei]|uniref:hypothetical protein n=1 Tax=Streptomyces noursei TaxID=1971 RepID=UPI003814E4A4